ncbi:hypothetical protein DY251_13225 [Mesorhizobium denitrificans]|uniref:Uncharacterized protein n=1 Tax=Mesorhizobium denitrificans TaxID=2294114 RepID=A0A371XD15_9HYPH|nr:hypothetical protein DY251_13225 [Mesorhizobium denitrificans]
MGPMRFAFCGFPQLGAFFTFRLLETQIELFVDLAAKKTNIGALAAVWAAFLVPATPTSGR